MRKQFRLETAFCHSVDFASERCVLCSSNLSVHQSNIYFIFFDLVAWF